MKTLEHYNTDRFQLNDLFKLDFQLLWASYRHAGIYYACRKLEQVTPNSQHLLMLWLLSKVENATSFNEAWEQAQAILKELGIEIPLQQPVPPKIPSWL